MEFRDWKFSEATVKSFANKVVRRLFSVGVPTLSREDIEQELWIAWCLAVKSYQPETNVPFLAYLRGGMRLHMNRHIEKNVGRRISEVWAKSFDAPVTEADGASAMSLTEIVASPDPSPLVKIEEDQLMAKVTKRLSEDARIFLNILYNQPPEILAEVRALQARSDYARERGMSTFFSNRLTSAVIFDAMGISTHKRGKILREIEKVAAKRL